MKRSISAALAFILAFSLTACSSSEKPADQPKEEETAAETEENTEPEKEETTETEEKEEEKEEEAEPEKEEETDAAESAEETSGSDEEEEPSDEEEKEPAEKESVFEQFTAVDTDDYTITVNKLTPDNYGEFLINVTYENKTDKTVYFSAKYIFVNNVMVSAYGSESVAAGKKAKDDVSFYNDSLSGFGITEYTDIEVVFNISDDATYDDIGEHEVHIYPYGEDAASVFEREPESSDIVLVDNDDICVIAVGYISDDTWDEFKAVFYIVNKTDKTLIFSEEETSVNGFMVDPSFSTVLPAGKCTFDYMTFYKSSLEENDIDEVEEIEFKLQAYDYYDYSNDIIDEVFTLHVK